MKKRKRWTQAYDGEWRRPVLRGYRVSCCDCGLVHRYDFKIVQVAKQKRLIMRASRDSRATAGRRRARHYAKVARALR